MKSKRQGAGAARDVTRSRWAAPAAGRRSFLRAQMGALALVAGGLVLAAPAQALPAQEPTQVSAAHTGALVRFGDDHPLLGGAARRGGLPFGRHDVAILMFGGTIVTLAAAGAPFLLRPLRGGPPALATAATESEPILPASALATAAHVPA
ncbi:MAG: hypothetical protein M3326_14595, partial [Actinomycetota bacterium]|nr:hypothetical protein [Actinomycetota bacterium]